MCLDFPSSAVDRATQLRWDVRRQICNQHDLRLAITGRLIQPQDDPSQAISAALGFGVVDPDRLLEDFTGFAFRLDQFLGSRPLY
jgi:hypothetical protein